MKLTAKEVKRLNFLYDKAVSNYLDKTDFNPCDALEDKEAKEYIKLIDKEDS